MSITQSSAHKAEPAAKTLSETTHQIFSLDTGTLNQSTRSSEISLSNPQTYSNHGKRQRRARRPVRLPPFTLLFFPLTHLPNTHPTPQNHPS